MIIASTKMIILVSIVCTSFPTRNDASPRLYEEGVELPSDLAGLVYIRLDDAGGWKLPLAKELQAAGVAIEAGKLLG